MRCIAPVDPHVHMRDTEYTQPYFQYAFDDAVAVGLRAIMEMPNTTPPLTTPIAIAERLHKRGELAFKHDLPSDIFLPKHYIHGGITNDRDQIIAMLTLIKTARSSAVVADKIFYTHSTGNMGLLDPELQEWIWKLKGVGNYRGVSIGHFEDEALFRDVWDPKKPITHSQRQTEMAELLQVQRQLEYAYNADFQGTFYVAHVSSPETLEFLHVSRKYMPFRIVAEVTWHHLFLNCGDYRTHGNLVKMNPPLRQEASQQALLHMVLNGFADIIGTDHAPHPLARKLDEAKPASGIPALPFWPKGIELLRKVGMNPRLIENMTYRTANIIFGLGLSRKEIDVEYNPRLWDKYEFNPFSRVDGTTS